MKKKQKESVKAKKSGWLVTVLKIFTLIVAVIGLIWTIWFNSASLSVSGDGAYDFQDDGSEFVFSLKNKGFYAAKIINGYLAIVSYGDAADSEKMVYLFDKINYDKEIYRDETESIINLKNRLPVEKFKGHVHLLFVIYYRPFPFLPMLKKELTGIFYYNTQEGEWIKQSYCVNPQFFSEVFKALRLGKKPLS